MNPDIAAQWAEALESGEYKQTTKYLRRGEHYCCLGVLCVLYRQAHLDTSKWSATERFYVDSGEYESGVMPPRPVLMWSGLNENQAEWLANLNDQGASFETIAHNIRAKFLSPGYNTP